jgi:pimeloyl-ACP methyl ester carboxylesterase
MSTSGPLRTQKVRVSHLNGTSVSYHLATPVKGSKPTLVLIGGFTTGAFQFKYQAQNKDLLEAVNFLILEPLGHGNTQTNGASFTLWDSAYAFLQALEALGVQKAIVLGASMGSWIAARMALYAPEKVVDFDICPHPNYAKPLPL